MQRRHLLHTAAAAVLSSTGVWAQEKYPQKPIVWICPYGAGGNADNRSRQVAKAMGAVLGQPIVVDNKAGAGGNIGTEAIARAKPDGYTIGMGNFAPLAVNQALFKKINFNPLTDLVPICLIERGPLILMVRHDAPYPSVKDLVADAKARKGRLSYASGGIGGSHHLSGALFESTAGIDLVHAPYRSGSAAASDVMGGQVDMMFEQMYVALPGIASGRMRPLAITSKHRSPLLPDVPTMAEQGYPAVEVLNWQGLIGPKGLPADIVRQLNQACNQALQHPEVKDKLLGQGNELGGGSPQQFAALIRAESLRWAKVVRDARIEAE